MRGYATLVARIRAEEKYHRIAARDLPCSQKECERHGRTPKVRRAPDGVKAGDLGSSNRVLRPCLPRQQPSWRLVLLCGLACSGV